MEMVCPDCGMCQTHGNLNEIKKGQKDANGYTRCWPGKHAVGTKKGKNGGQVRNCVPNESMSETTGDKPFDTMMKTIKKGTGKQATADRKEQKQRNQEQTRQAIDNMFGGGNPADQLGIKKKGVAEGDDRTVANIKNYERELAKYKKFNANGAHDVKIKNLEKIIANLKSKQGVAEATGDERFDTMMGRMQKEPQIPDSQMPPTDVRDLYQWAVKNNKPYHKTFATWANREGFKSVAPALQKAGNLDSDALDYWTPDVWEMWYGSKMPKHWSKERIPDELRDYLETVFDAYDHIWTDWPTEYRQIGQQGVAENFADGKGPGRPGDSVRHGIPKHATMAELEKASHAKGRKGQLARWQLNMRRGHKK